MTLKKIMLLIFLLSASSVFSQTTSNPEDEIYTDLSIWENHGYISNLPPLRPYPVKIIIEFLKDVENRATGNESAKAAYYLSKLDTRYKTQLKISTLNRYSADSKYHGETGINWGIEGNPSELISLSGDINFYFIDSENDELLPAYTRSGSDKLEDWSDFDLFGKNYKIQQGFSSLAAYGNENIYFQAGIVRNSFGPFMGDSAVLSSTAPQTGHFSFTWREESFTFTTALLELTASDDTGDDIFPEKYLALHTVNFHPSDYVEIGLFETVVFGGRFEPMYIIPFSEFFYTQGFLGFPDNSLMGFSIKVKLPENIDYKFLIYADDLHFNDMIRFDFDTKYKLAFQTGFSWKPMTEKIKDISIDYLLVTPYMYTHKSQSSDTDNPNYLNYTHQGVNLGPDLDPNSDRLTLSVLLNPVEKLSLELKTRYIRHGNGSVDGSENVGGGDGSIFDDGYYNGEYTFQDTTRFMTQDIIEKITQLGIQSEYKWKTTGKTITASAGYTLEFIKNKNLTDQEEWNNIFNIGTTVTF